MPHMTKHTAALTEITDDNTKATTPYLAIRRASHTPDGAFRKNMSGGLWINLDPARPQAEIVRDLADAALAAIEFATLAQAEIAARTAAAQPKAAKKAA